MFEERLYNTILFYSTVFTFPSHTGELQNYYLRLIVANGVPFQKDTRVTYTFVWPPSTGTTVTLPQGATYYIREETQGTKMPDPIPVVITRSDVMVNGDGGAATAETRFFNYTTSPAVNQTMILGGGGAGGGSSGGGNYDYYYYEFLFFLLSIKRKNISLDFNFKFMVAF